MLKDIGTAGRWQTEWLLTRNRFITSVERTAWEEGKSEEEKKAGPPEAPLRDTVLDICDFMLMQKSPKAKEEKKKRYEMGGYSDAEFAPLV